WRHVQHQRAAYFRFRNRAAARPDHRSVGRARWIRDRRHRWNARRPEAGCDGGRVQRQRDSRRRRTRDQTRRPRVYSTGRPARDQAEPVDYLLEHPLRSSRSEGVTMRAAFVIRAFALVALLPVGSAFAQSDAAKPKPTDLSNADIQEAVK